MKPRLRPNVIRCGAAPARREPTGEVRFVVPGDPVPWARSRSNGRQHFTDATRRAYRAKVQGRAVAALAGYDLHTGRVALDLIAYMPDRRHRDWDNIGKMISDALNGIAWVDDEQVDDGRVRKRYGDPDTRIEVVVTPLAAPVRRVNEMEAP